MINRRTFIKRTSAAAAISAIPSVPLWAAEKSKKITILHTNDQHSRIEPFEVSDNPRYSNQGGFARRASLIEKIRQEEEHVLLLDAGDIFQGTPYFNFYGGELEFKLMSKMGYDASTIGNHDFDNGLTGLKKQLPNAKFDFLIANYDFSNTVLEGQFEPYKIFKKSGIKIGVFGVGIELKGLVGKDLYKETKYLNPVEIAQDMVAKLKQKNCDLIICLSHLGYEYKNESNKISDVKLAQQTSDIDLIIGGHTHTFLDTPQIYNNKKGEQVIVNQVGWAGLYLGRIDFNVSRGNKAKVLATNSIPVTANRIV